MLFLSPLQLYKFEWNARWKKMIKQKPYKYIGIADKQFIFIVSLICISQMKLYDSRMLIRGKKHGTDTNYIMEFYTRECFGVRVNCFCWYICLLCTYSFVEAYFSSMFFSLILWLIALLTCSGEIIKKRKNNIILIISCNMIRAQFLVFDFFPQFDTIFFCSSQIFVHRLSLFFKTMTRW